MTRTELLDWAQTTGRIAPTPQVREAWGNAYDRNPDGVTEQLRALPPTALTPTPAVLEAAWERAGTGPLFP